MNQIGPIGYPPPPSSTAWLGERHAAFWSQRRDTKLYYQALVELSGQIPFLADRSGLILTIAAQWEQLTGVPVEHVLEHGLADAIHPDDMQRMLRGWWRAVRRDARFDAQCRLRRADGAYGWVRVRGCALQNPDGEVSWLGIIEDTDAQHQLHAEAVIAEQRYRLAALASDNLIWDHDLITGMVRLGPTESGLIEEVPPDLVYPEEGYGLIHPTDLPCVRESYLAACKGMAEVWTCNYRLRGRNGYAVVTNCAYIIRDETGQAVRVVGAIRDLTAQLKLEELQAELVRVQQVSEMGAMASMLAHELNQPLTAVTGYIRGAQRLLMQGNEAAVERSVEAMELAAETALSAGMIVRRLRDLVTRGEGAVATHDLFEIVEQACTVALAGAPQWRIERRFYFDPAARRVVVDRVQVTQVLVNLLRNAMTAMNEVTHRLLTIHARVDEECAEVSIADSGTGIPPEQQARLFQPFSSTTRAGMGIGLSICRVLIEANGGRIWLKQSNSEGTEFRFTVPLADGKD